MLRAVCIFLISFFLLNGFSVCFAAKIGIALPDTYTSRWKRDGKTLKEELEATGNDVLLVYADKKKENQIDQIEEMINKECDAIIVTPVDGSSLTAVLDKAKKANIKIIAYDRLIMNSDAISYYASFDNYKVGLLLGEYIEKRLHLKKTSITNSIEFFNGSLDDNNAKILWAGAMEVLKKYLVSGRLICKSKQTSIEETAVHRWLGEYAIERMNSLVKTLNYGPGNEQNKLDAILCPNDTIATAVIDFLTKICGYDPSNIPVITGQDCSVDAARNISKGLQSMCVFKDSRVLAIHVAEMTNQMLLGEEVKVNDTTSYDNGTGLIPSYLCSPLVVTKDNLREILIESGYYKLNSVK